MNERLGPLPPDQLSPAQRQAAQALVDGPRGALYGPFVPLLRSPELMDCAQRMGEYLRYRSAIGVRLSELAILVTARQWNQQVEWVIHAPIAARCGLGADLMRINGYYTLLAMVMNGACTPAPEQAAGVRLPP
jgi:4-carboxymuconolactone decarboxylase